MKIQSRIISIEIDIDEWKKAKKDWDDVLYSTKPVVLSPSKIPNLYDLITCIELVANNPAHKIDKKINTY